MYRGEDCMKNFCTSLKEHATYVTNFEKKKMLPLTRNELKLNQDATECFTYGRILATCAGKPKVPDLIPAAGYVHR